MQQLGRLETLLSFSAGIGILNLATSITTYALLSRRLDVLEKKIEKLYELILKEFDAAKKAKLQAAMLAARNAVGMDKPRAKEIQAHIAIDRLNEVRFFMLQDIGTAFMDKNTLKGRVEAFARAVDVDSMLVRCHLELDELGQARNHLSDNLDEYEKLAGRLVHQCLNHNRARFFHKSFNKRELYRFVAIEDWLHRKSSKWSSNSEDDALMKVLELYRKRFWEKDIIKFMVKWSNQSDDITDLERIALAEWIIEKFEGFRGFSAELEGIARLKISYSEWEKQQEEALERAKLNLAEHDDYALLVDTDWLAEQKKTAAA